MKKEILVKKWIDDMIAHGFMSGWGGDKSDKFKKEQYDSMIKVLNGDIKLIGGNYRLLATIFSDYGNLKQYCGWKETELNSLLELFGFEKIEHVLAVMGCDKNERDTFMKDCKLVKGVKFYLTPSF